jgi:hypothetical protein
MSASRSSQKCWCLLTGLVLVSSSFFAGDAVAQRPYERRNLVTSNMAPGLAAQTAVLSNPCLADFVQPVRVIAPNEARLEVGGSGGYTQTHSARVTVGMMIGPVYRLKVTQIPNHPTRELYPSIEVLGRLHTPLGLEEKFPIQVNILQDDLDRALEGSMVTKVIYLEDPDTAFPHRHVEDRQPYFDVFANEDPLRAAERLGRPMAILRIGTRVPTFQPNDQGFDFNTPTPTIIEEIEVLGKLPGRNHR